MTRCLGSLRTVLCASVALGTTAVLAPLCAQESPPRPAPELAWLTTNEPRPTPWAIEVGAIPSSQALAAWVGPGQATFLLRCAACHGNGGRGDGPLASSLVRPPRDLAGGALRTRDREGPIAPSELYRVLSAGAPAQGMPAFAHLSPFERWSLVAFVLALRGEDAALARPTPLPARPQRIDPSRGAEVFAARCAFCHGADGDGRGPAAKDLADAEGRPCPPTDLRRGPAVLRGGARQEDIARSIYLGRPGTKMAGASDLPAEDLWALAAHVERLVREGDAARRAAWDRFFAARRAAARAAPRREVRASEERWEPARSEYFSRAPGGRQGCLACHEGISAIASGAMAEALAAFSGGDAERECVLCHEGRAGEASKERAHEGLVANPGSLWATSIGLGCGKCHSDRGALTTLHGRPLPEPTGGSLMSVVSRQTDPSGASGRNHAYRIQRALMAQETGKAFLVSASAGLVKDRPRFTDFAVDDPDGAVPCVGSPAYREFVARAEKQGFLLRLDRGQGYPTFEEAEALTGNPVQAAYADTYRKDCARCHLWGEGKAATGERRSSGCSACHVLNAPDGQTFDDDPTVPDDRPGHPLRHRLVLAIPEEQCNHCHTRGVLTLHSDVHQQAGVGCVDCHTSIDVHGDGNIYGAIPHQLEVRCEDCHGTREAAPWELPVGHGTPAAGTSPRGVYEREGVRHLLTSRGNPRSNWRREGERVVVRSFLDGREHVAPLLRDAAAKAPKATTPPAAPSGGCSAARDARHDRLACSACHNQQAPRCLPCHTTYFSEEFAQDWLLSALDYDTRSLRQRAVFTPGAADPRPLGGRALIWGPPDVRLDRSGRLNPHIPGCEVHFTYVGRDGKVDTSFVPHHDPDGEGYPPPVAPSLPHEFSTPRGCADCHPEGAEPGRPIVLPGAQHGGR